ncbi:MAG: hypothetical protein ACXVDD_29965 [Polyangia bacterium]
MSELLTNDWFRLVADDGFLRITRSSAPPPSPAQMAALYDELTVALRKAGARRLLLDLRAGPTGRNDPEFERSSEKWRETLAKDFERVAILVRTAVGKLHIQRLGREVGRAPAVFMDEAEALAFVRTS